ncbi:MAG: succinate dehydrogenase/fumarate reductase iron-sulfur subunit [Deltaproteobacteria bacterium]
MSDKTFSVKLHVWRQADAKAEGKIVDYVADDVSPHMSFLEMLDVLNEKLMQKGEEPIAFDHDCREGICGMCSAVINGIPHGGHKGVTACQLHMRNFKNGDDIWVEPWRAKAFPLLRDLIVDRSAFDRIIQAGGYVSVATGGTPDGNAIPIPKAEADLAMDAAACIGCGACVAACKNASAMLFVAAKVSQLRHLPQGATEQYTRAKNMVVQMDKEGFGSCSNLSQCEAVCPKQISTRVIAELNQDLLAAQARGL